MINEPDDFARARKFGELLPTLGPESLPVVKEALEAAAALEMTAVEFELLLHYWVRHDAPGAAWYALTGSPRAFRVAAIYGAVTPWVRSDPEAALPTVRTFGVEQSDYGTAAQNALVRGWYESGKPGLEDYIHSLGEGFERQRALSAYASAIIRAKGAAAGIAWAESIPEDDKGYKLDVMRRTATSLVSRDLDAAKRFCEKHCEGEFGSSMRSRIAEVWSRDDPRGAIEWLAGAPEGQDTKLSVRLAFANWGIADRPAALRWMKEQIEKTDPSGQKTPEWLEPALGIYARQLAKDSPAEGVVWAERLKDKRERRVVILDIAHDWYHKGDQAAAEAWLAQSSLPEDARAMVRDPEVPRVTEDPKD